MVRTAARLLRRQGYAATGWRQVVADSETPWGSQAHHFPGGKEQLVTESVNFAGGRYERLLQAGLDGAHPADFVAAWADLAAAELKASDWADGCPVATVTLEMAHKSEAVAAACGRALGGWQRILTEAIAARGVPDAEAGDLATLVLAGIEGGLILARANRNGGPLHTVGSELSKLLRARVPA
jgi:TetR/AcrR family transcriptional repressor of lmrAB and yxaGH operons